MKIGRWRTTRILFTIWEALMWSDEEDRRRFLTALLPINTELLERAKQQKHFAEEQLRLRREKRKNATKNKKES